MGQFLSSLSWSDLRDIIGLVLVALGVAGELFMLTGFAKNVLAIPFNPTNCDRLELKKKLWEIMFSSLIVIGLALEVSAWPQHIREVIALKNENLKLRNPRTLSIGQMGIIENTLAGTPRGKISVQHVLTGDAPTFAFMLELEFSKMGYNVWPPLTDSPYLHFMAGNTNGTLPDRFDTLQIVFNPSNTQYGLKIGEALTNADIPAEFRTNPSIGTNEVEIDVFERP